MLVTCGETCFELTREKSQEVLSLRSNHEEADTRLILHVQHAAGDYQAIVFVADDTDVFGICLSRTIKSNLFTRRGTRSRIRVIDGWLQHYRRWCVFSTPMDPRIVTRWVLSRAKERWKYRETFISLGESWNLSHDIFTQIEEFTCTLYSKKTKLTDVNTLRYHLFCAKMEDIESGQLPPWEDTLQQHTLRANYPTAIWRHNLESVPDIPAPSEGHRWVVNNNEELTIQWMTGVPAPYAVLCSISCRCAQSCSKTDCSCMLNGLRCSELCKLQSCIIMAQDVSDVRKQDQPCSSAMTFGDTQ